MKLKLKNPFLCFLPFFVFYIIFVLMYPTEGTFGDESRYLIYGRYMIDGYLPSTDLNFDYLGDGPGYSIFLIPFIYFKTPLIWIALCNAVFFYLSVVFLFKTLIQFVSFKTAFIASLFWACYINAYEYIVLINAETFTLFLISLMLFFVTKIFKSPKAGKYIIISGIILGYITLTKVIFGYVLLCMILGTVILWMLNRKLGIYKKAIALLMVAFIVTTPYLIHTYKTTNKIFYWSTYGGTNLYWMSSPDENEYGSWFTDPNKKMDSSVLATHTSNLQQQLQKSHQKDFEEIDKYTGAEQDDVFKRLAIRNIKADPGKFFHNCISNIGRLLFNFPYSYKIQNSGTLLRLPFTGIIVILFLLCLIPTIRNWRRIDFSIRFLILLTMIYFGGSILGSAETRMFTIIVPILLIWLASVSEKIFKINLGSWKNQQ